MPQTARSGKGGGTVPHFNVMAKPGGARCNLDCRYCYYLDKTRLWPGEKRFRMSEEMLDRYIRQMIAAGRAAGQSEIRFHWQGGEPAMLGLDFFRDVVRRQQRHRPAGVTIRNALQTNGTLLTEDWARFLADEEFLVGVSVDGPPALHDRYRVDRAGRPSSETVMSGIDRLRGAGAAFNLLCTLNRHNVLKPKAVYRFLRGLGSDHIQFIPVVERRDGAGALAPPPQQDAADAACRVTSWSVPARAYGRFLCEVFDIWRRQDAGRVSVQLFEVQLGLRLGAPAGLCVFAETCGDCLALEHDGTVFACDHYVYDAWRIGNIRDRALAEIAADPALRRFGRDKAARLPGQCRRCPYLRFCHGGCPKHRFLTSADGESGLNYFCEAYRRFFAHAGADLDRMARQVAMRGPAAMT